MLLSCECDFCACFFVLFYFFCNFCFLFFLKLQHSTPLYTIDDRHCSAAGCCAHNFAMFEKTRKATTLNRSFLSPSRLFSPSHRRGREKGQNCCKTKEMDRNEICNLPLRHRSSPAPPPLRFMLRCSVIFLFQRFLFFFYPFAPCARFVCLLSVSPGPRVVYVHAPALHFQFVSVSSLVVTCFFSLSLSLTLLLSYSFSS